MQQTLEQLLKDPGVQIAAEHARSADERTLEDQAEISRIPAPPFAEEERARRMAELMADAGLDQVRADEIGNVLADLPGVRGGAPLVISAHLDTVFPEGTDVTVRQSGDTLFAPGIGDDTRGIVLVLTVLRAMEDAGIETEDDLLFEQLCVACPSQLLQEGRRGDLRQFDESFERPLVEILDALHGLGDRRHRQQGSGLRRVLVGRGLRDQGDGQHHGDAREHHEWRAVDTNFGH